MKLKQYKVWFVIKKNNHGYLKSMEVEASNQKQAKEIVDEEAARKYGAHAFWKTFKQPVERPDGSVEYDGSVICPRVYKAPNGTITMLW